MSLFKLAMLSTAILAEATLARESGSDSYYKDNKGRIHLKLDNNNEFRIMQLTDLHFGEDKDRDKKTIQMIRDIIRKEDPDFMAVTGDLLSGQMYDFDDSDMWADYFHKFFDKLNDLDIPWGFVPGFHDYETDWGNKQMLKRIAKNPLHTDAANNFKFLGQGIENGFNFQVPIETNDNQSTEVGRIWFLGTGMWKCLGQLGRDCIRRSQIEWFKEESQKIGADDKFRQNGITFMHTPLQEHLYMVNSMPVHGQRRDNTECQALNTGFYAEALQQGTVKWVSVGSDHSSDYWGIYGGMGLSYGRKSGFGSYGPKFAKHGARMFNLKFDLESGNMDVDTWIREEDGIVDNQEEWVPPQTFSWLNNPYCHGSEVMTEEQKESFYATGSIFAPEVKEE